MEHRSLGTIVVAGVVSLALIATAFVFSRPNPPTVAVPGITVETRPTIATEDRNGNGMPDWQEALRTAIPATAATTSSYIAPPSLPPTEALARELFASYAGAKQDGSLDMDLANAAIEEAVGRRSPNATPPKIYSYSSLSIHADVPVATYEGALMLTLQQAAQVTEYELTTFSRTLKGSNADVKRLESAAVVYADIAAQLAKLQIPPTLASSHLSTLNSLSTLSSATKDLAGWSGDPLDALSLVNTFVAADNAFSDNLTTLMAQMRTLGKKT